MNGLRRRGLKAVPAFHLVELLDASIQGYSEDQLLSGDTQNLSHHQRGSA
jgi:glycolate oxidase iron-sulfur subunit